MIITISETAIFTYCLCNLSGVQASKFPFVSVHEVEGHTYQKLPDHVALCPLLQTCNNQTLENGRRVYTNLTLQVMMTSGSLGHLKNIYGFIWTSK